MQDVASGESGGAGADNQDLRKWLLQAVLKSLFAKYAAIDRHTRCACNPQ